MPSLDEMTCPVCGEIGKKSDIESFGMCYDCNVAIEATAKEFEESQPGEDAEVSDLELKKTVEAYHKRQEYMKSYNQRPEVQAKRKEYMRGRNERNKALTKKAKDLGLL